MKSKEGFTLLELIAVLSISAVVAVWAVLAFWQSADGVQKTYAVISGGKHGRCSCV